VVEQVVVDTNVAAYLVLQTQPFYLEVAEFWQEVKFASAPVHWQAEIAQTIWMAARAGLLHAATAADRLSFAGDLPISAQPLSPLWPGALQRAIRCGVAVYDTLFVELAARRGCPLVTYDQQLLREFPDIACRPAALL